MIVAGKVARPQIGVDFLAEVRDKDDHKEMEEKHQLHQMHLQRVQEYQAQFLKKI